MEFRGTIHSYFTAVITDSNDNVVIAAYTVVREKFRSIIFGRVQYVDKQTNGNLFSRSGPSINFQNYMLTAEIQSGDKKGEIITDNNLQCTQF